MVSLRVHATTTPPPGHSCEKLRLLLIQVTQVLGPSYKLTDLGWRLTLVVQRSSVGMRDARLPSVSRVGTQIDTGDSTVHTEGCTHAPRSGHLKQGRERAPWCQRPLLQSAD